MPWRFVRAVSFIALPGVVALVATALLSCNTFQPPPTKGGGKLSQDQCGGVTVITSDSMYHSTGVGLIAYDGTVLSPLIIHSEIGGSGLSQTLSNDVIAPHSATPAPHIVLIDESEAAVITSIDGTNASVEWQIKVDTGFHNANPHDYLQLDATKAYVSRYEDNAAPGYHPFDRGGDVLILDLGKRVIVGSIDMHAAFADEDPSIHPSPGRMVLADGKLYVLCAAYSGDFKKNGDSKIVTVDTSTDQIVATTTLPGSYGCDGLALSPNGERLAVACTGSWGGADESAIGASAAIVLQRSDMSVVSRLPASSFGKNSLGFSITFASNDQILFNTFGSITASPIRHDTIIQSSVDGTEHQVLLESQSDQEVVVLNDVRCENACGACFVTDADRGVIHRFAIDGETLSAPTDIKLDDHIGLLPRYLGSIGAALP